MAGYLGNKFDMIVHHLAVMKPKCKIYDIKKQDSVYFVPDILDQARKERFVPCKYCVKNEVSITQRDLAEAAGVTEVTIRNRYKGLKLSQQMNHTIL